MSPHWRERVEAIRATQARLDQLHHERLALERAYSLVIFPFGVLIGFLLGCAVS